MTTLVIFIELKSIPLQKPAVLLDKNDLDPFSFYRSPYVRGIYGSAVSGRGLTRHTLSVQQKSLMTTVVATRHKNKRRRQVLLDASHEQYHQ
jgi:hypothetical protein